MDLRTISKSFVAAGLSVAYCFRQWHIARRIESFVRVYQSVMTLLQLRLNLLEFRSTTKSTKDAKRLLERGKQLDQHYFSLIQNLEPTSRDIAGGALSYVGSTILLIVTASAPIML